MKPIEIRIKAMELAIANIMRNKPVLELSKEYEAYIQEVNDVTPIKKKRNDV